MAACMAAAWRAGRFFNVYEAAYNAAVHATTDQGLRAEI